jgi:glycosyltransferase involved in cell wall biosynthesis
MVSLMQDKIVVFVRQLHTYTGGHGKVFDYIRHVASTEWAKPLLYLTPDSDVGIADEYVPHNIERVKSIPDASLYFVAGMDWEILDAAGVDLSNQPVINFIQGIRHANPGDPRYPFLTRPAVRICVSPEVAAAVHATGVVNGPVVTIPNGIALADMEHSRPTKRIHRVFIGGLKNHSLANECAETLSQLSVPIDLCIEPLSRADYLARLASSEIAVLLPLPEEGFYLPALEAMALGTVPVVPDCIGARSFCVDGQTCIVPAYSARAICDRAVQLLADTELRDQLRTGGHAMAARHSLAREREQFVGVLRRSMLDEA